MMSSAPGEEQHGRSSDRSRPGHNAPKLPSIIAGQRWISEMEPELGLGLVVRIEMRRVTISFHDGVTNRVYTLENAPLRRIQFKAGNQIRTIDGRTLTVLSAEQQSGLVTYNTAQGPVCETELSGSIRITAPLDRLLAQHTDLSDKFALRTQILLLRQSIASSPVHGFVGGRIELIPHQLYIAHEVSGRHVRRVLLADEVGLGKTIEASLILHRLLISGRAAQVLIVVPEALLNVWFVELLRKFNLLFRILDRDYLDSLVKDEDSGNALMQESLVLTSLDLLTEAEDAREKAFGIEWDTLIVDEAHHAREGTPRYDIIDTLTQRARDVFLLTATPQQYGEKSHFARLRMLDPARYSDYDQFVIESKQHAEIAATTGRLLDGAALEPQDIEILSALLGDSNEQELANIVRNENVLSDDDRRELVAGLLDRHGIGRALFRNTRGAIGEFPSRQVFTAALDGTKHDRENVTRIFSEDFAKTELHGKRILTGDPRIAYLSSLLQKLPNEKLLVICRRKETALAIAEALKKLIAIDTALFHEELSLIQRDRNAAWFAETEGARIMVCSEIGSEGRNFQFVHHLVLFDLPVNPELVEQRIGRLDRIGQRETIRIYVPAVAGTPEDTLRKWFHEGLGIFDTTVPAAQEVFETLGSELKELLRPSEMPPENRRELIENLIQRTASKTAETTERLRAGRDRLLEQHSFRPHEAAQLVMAIRKMDEGSELRDIMKLLFKERGILVEEFQEHTWKLLSEDQLDDAFPGLLSSRSVVTFDRATALRREDIEFLTIDHPAVLGGIDLFVGSESGNAAVAIRNKGAERELFLEAVFIADCIAPRELNVERYLPPSVVRVIIDNKLNDRSTLLNGNAWETSLDETAHLQALDKDNVKQRLIPSMYRRAQEIAAKQCSELVNNALLRMQRLAGAEVDRLKALSESNVNITAREIALATDETACLDRAIRNTAPRLDSLRLVLSPGGK